MKKQNENHQSNQREHLPTSAPEATNLNDLPVNEAQQVAIKGGVVALEYLLLGTCVPPPPAGTITSRP